MLKEKSNIVQQDKKVVDKIVNEMTMFDDDLMSRVFDKNIEATELVLRIILNKKIKVISVEGQDVMKNHKVDGRSIILDVHALDESGQEMDIEVQGNSEGAHVKRARYHSSMMDTRMLKAGQEFRELKDSYVIFIYKWDKFKEGLPIYHIERYVSETDEPFNDGSHIIYINGSYKGDDDIGHLISDFHQIDSKDMYYKELAQSVKHFKKVEEGREIMSELVQKYAEKYAKEYADERVLCEKVKSVKNLMDNMKVTLEQALNALGIQGDDRVKITQQIQK